MISARRASVVVATAVALAAGGYTLIYLARWEWHRAIITAIFFVAAEIALVAGLVLRRLNRLEARLDTLAAPPASPPGPPPAPDADDPPGPMAPEEPAPSGARRHFAWLSEGLDGRLSVFLPVMVGAGVLVSAVAWAVEALARATARPGSTVRMDRRLEPLTWPAGGLCAEPDAPTPRPSRRRRFLPGVAAVVGVVMVVAAIDALADAIQTRPEPERHGVMTTFLLEIRGQGAGNPVRVGRELWGVCQTSMRRSLPAPIITHLADSRITLAVERDLGRSALARMRGCLQDPHIDYLQASVVDVQVVEPDDNVVAVDDEDPDA